MTAAVLHREAFRTSRLLEFCNQKELTAQTGHAPEEWPVVILKELVDNALDAAEEANIAAEIEIKVSTKTAEIVVADNGPGVPCETVKHVLDYSVRVSSREAYVNPTRGAQGNALKTLVAMLFALDGTCGDVVIEAEGVAHRIGFAVDQLRQEPRIIYETGPSDVKSGTCVMVNWPDSACSILDDAKDRFLQIAEDFAWLNPHTRVRVEWNSVTHIDRSPSDPGWKKWRACDPTSAHWYDLARLERYIAAHVSRDRDHGRARTVRDFITEFRRFSGSRKQKVALEETGLARASLSSLFGGGGEPKRTEIELDALKKHSKPVKPGDLGLIGQDHLLARFKETGVDERTFKYQKVLGGADDGLPWAVETAFGWCPKEINQRRIIAGVNWSVGLGNPFRSFGRHGGEGLESILAEQRAGRSEPIAFVLHVACPRIEYTDRGKSTIVIPEEPAMTNASSPAQGIKVAVQGVTGDWAKQRKAEERRARSSSTRSHYLVRIRSISIKEAAYRAMEKAYMAAPDNGRLPVKPRQIMYAARPSILELTGKDHLGDTYFTQTLLPDYIEEHDDDAWDIVWDARGTFVEPHSNLPIPLGTLEVRQYLGARPDFGEKDDGADIDFTINSRFSNLGPEDRYRTVLYIEKEGFGALLKSVRIAERFDLACMSNKGMSVTATRMLLDRLVERGGRQGLRTTRLRCLGVLDRWHDRDR